MITYLLTYLLVHEPTYQFYCSSVTKITSR